MNQGSDEEGLLGLAFDPGYQDNGYFNLYYSATDPRRSVLSRFSVREDDPSAADRIASWSFWKWVSHSETTMEDR